MYHIVEKIINDHFGMVVFIVMIYMAKFPHWTDIECAIAAGIDIQTVLSVYKKDTVGVNR